MPARTSLADGYWDVAGTWVGGLIPGDGDSAIIGHHVTIRGDTTVGANTSGTTSAITINAGGILDWEANGNYTLTLKGRVYINAGGIWKIGDATNRIPADKTATVQFSGFAYQNIVEGEMYLYGAENYHMGHSAYQRAILITDVAAGADKQFQVSSPVDWRKDDILWFGTGGDPAETPTDCEQIIIKTKIDSSTYTADFANAHYGDGTHGDLVIHGTRNVNIIGQNGLGFSIYTNATYAWVINVSWVRFRYGGRATTIGAAIACNAATNRRIATDSLKMQSTVFDTPGVVTAHGFCWYNGTWEEDQSQENFNEVHFWGFAVGLQHTTTTGRFFYGHLSFLNIQSGIVNSADTICDIGGFWYVCDTTWTNVSRKAISTFPVKIKDFKIHRSYQGFYITSYSAGYSVSSQLDLTNGEIYHSYKQAYMITGASVNSARQIFSNVDFYRSETDSLICPSGGAAETLFINCKFDAANQGNGAAYAAVEIAQTYAFGLHHFINCDFGLREQNKQYNVTISGGTIVSSGRILAENCKFVEPLNYAGSIYDWVNDHLMWAIGQASIDDWRKRATLSAQFSLEYVACEIRDSLGVDQWPTDYPNTDRVGLLVGGSEIHRTHPTNEAAGYIDGTFRRKIYPFMGTDRQHVTRIVPIRIPASSGDTVTVSLSFKKNISQTEYDRPMIHLEGCGIYDEEVMPDLVNNWSEISVSGTALYDGTFCFWISCKGVQDFHTAAAPPAKAMVADYTWAYPYDIALASNLVLYADGLKIERV